MDDGLAEFERRITGVDDRIVAARDAEIDRPGMMHRSARRGRELRPVGGRDHGQIGDGAMMAMSSVA